MHLARLFFNMTEELKIKLKNLAEKYETSQFITSDPSQFLCWYKERCDIELAAFTAALLSFGNRRQFIPKIQEIFTHADKNGSFSKWILSQAYEKDFNAPDGNNDKKFYRFYSYEDMKILFRTYKKILEEYKSLGQFVQSRYEKESLENKNPSLNQIISEAFPNCSIVPKGKNSPNKRIHMFLRWMVRQNSPVDLGLWSWYKAENLIIPLDTHVLQEAKKMCIIDEKANASLKTAIQITGELKQIWPNDPCKGDFALFGLGVDKDN